MASSWWYVRNYFCLSLSLSVMLLLLCNVVSADSGEDISLSSSSHSSVSEAVGPLEEWVPIYRSSSSSSGNSTNNTANNSTNSASSVGHRMRHTKGIPETESSSEETSASSSSDNGDNSNDVSEKVRHESTESSGLTDETVSSSSSKMPVFERPFNVSEQQRLRFKKIIRDRRKRVLSKVPKIIDPRGDVDIRICSINLNGYATRAMRKKFFGKIDLAFLKGIESTVSQAVKRADCDVVAVQGIVAEDYVTGKKAIKRLAERVAKRSGARWTAFSGDPSRRREVLGFLVNGERVEIVGLRAYRDVELLAYVSGKAEMDAAYPLQLTVRTIGESWRRVSVLNFDLRKLGDVVDERIEYNRIQMAEAIRELAKFALADQRAYDQRVKGAEQEPIFLVVGDLGVERHNPVHWVLRGRLKLNSFGKSGPCILTTEKVKNKKRVGYKCESATQPGTWQAEELFELLSDDEGPSSKKVSRIVDGEQRWFKLKPTKARYLTYEQHTLDVGVFLTQNNLALARKEISGQRWYDVGFEKVKNKLLKSPLVWIGLNWHDS